MSGYFDEMKSDPEHHIIRSLLPELFHHGHHTFDNYESEGICPACKEEFGYNFHSELASHILYEHPKLLEKYANSIREMLRDPVSYFSFVTKYDKSGGNNSLLVCDVCGTRNIPETEMKRHMLTHKEYFDSVVSWLKEHSTDMTLDEQIAEDERLHPEKYKPK